MNSTVKDAYDTIAGEYDRQLAGDTWMREVLWQRYRAAFHPGEHVLDVGCGTGTDAIFLARHGIRVTGIDLSPAMLAQAERKVTSHGLAPAVRLLSMDLAALDHLPAGEFDGIISSFASLNTSPSLSQFAADAARLLRPNGRMILHLLSGGSLWERVSLIRHGRWSAARELEHRREHTFPVGGRPIQHYLPRADDVYTRYFARDFQLCRARGLGITRPPRSIRHVPEGALIALARLDGLIGSHRPWIDWGRFVVLEMVTDSRLPEAQRVRHTSRREP